MATDIWIFTESYSYKPNAVASTSGTSVGTNLPALSIDNDRATGWETTDATPRLNIDLGEARDIGGFWMYSSNTNKYRLYHSADGISYSASFAETSDAGQSGYNRVEDFASQNVRYWRVEITEQTTPANSTFIYEVMLFKKILEYEYALNVQDINPTYRIPISGGYELASGTRHTFSSGVKKTDYQIGLIYIDRDTSAVAALESIEAAVNDNPVIVTAFEPLRYEKTLQSVWGQPNQSGGRDFSYPFSTQLIANGYRVSLNTSQV